MRRLTHAIRKYLPHRRRRFWKYVSARRHGAGWTTFALLVAAVALYFTATYPPRVEREAEQYLEGLTGGHVEIDQARFRFFGGIHLSGVRLYMPARGRDAPWKEPFFTAEELVLRHDPWKLFSLQLQPREIVCQAPVVTLEYDPRTGQYNLRRLLELAPERGETPEALAGRLPSVWVRDARLVIDEDLFTMLSEGPSRDAVTQSATRSATQRGRAPRREMIFNMSMVSARGDPNLYRVRFDELAVAGRDGVHGEIKWNPLTGDIEEGQTSIPLQGLDRTLPARLRQWRERHELSGNVVVTQLPGLLGEPGRRRLELDNVAFRLLPEEGGVAMEEVRGRILADADRIWLQDVTGRLRDWGEARIHLSGVYEGYEEDAPFDVTIEVRGLEVPDEPPRAGRVADVMRMVRRTYAPRGPVNVDVRLWRDADGKLDYSGVLMFADTSIAFEHFPYRMRDVRGRVTFDPNTITLHEIIGRAGPDDDPAVITVSGTVAGDGRSTYDVDVRGKDVPLDDELHDALPEQYETFWRHLSPQGRTDVTVDVTRNEPNGPEDVKVVLQMDGRGAIEYSGFPYRLGDLTGEVVIRNDDVEIRSLRGVRGPVHAVIDGRLLNLGRDAQRVDLLISGANLPLDDKLAAAMPAHGRKALEALNADGLASAFDARVWQNPGDELDWRVQVQLADVGIRLEAFPYALRDTTGRVTIGPETAVLEDVQGRHDGATVTANGKVYLREELGLDVRVVGRRIKLDDDFHEALPERFGSVWRQFRPGGTADLDLSLQQAIPGAARRTDYTLVITAHEMSARYSELPYPLQGITGSVTATPEKVVIDDLIARDGDAVATLAGEVLLNGDTRKAELTLTGRNVPIDRKLLDAVPQELAALARHFEPVGECDLDLRRLGISRATTRPGAPDEPNATHWVVEGRVALRDAIANVGFGRKTLSGEAAGRAVRSADGLALDADMKLSEMSVGPHRVTDLEAKIVKGAAEELLQFRELAAAAYGGRLAGFAEIELADPMRYGIRLTVDRLKMAKLLVPAGADEEARKRAAGLVDGRIELTETAGKIDTREAAGVLRISDARLSRLPVLLDLLTVVLVPLREGAWFSEGECSYVLRGQKLVLQEIWLRGPQLSLVGSGWMNMDTQKIRLNFLAGPPGKLPRLGGLAEEFLSNIFREIMEIEVTGTLQRPRTRARTLRSLEEALERLLTPDAGS